MPKFNAISDKDKKSLMKIKSKYGDSVYRSARAYVMTGASVSAAQKKAVARTEVLAANKIKRAEKKAKKEREAAEIKAKLEADADTALNRPDQEVAPVDEVEPEPVQ